MPLSKLALEARSAAYLLLFQRCWPLTRRRTARPRRGPPRFEGQTLYVTDGIGYVASRGGRPQQIRPGDVVYIEPGEEHWHGVTPERLMAHVAIQEADERGEVVTWGAHVTDEEYTQPAQTTNQT